MLYILILFIIVQYILHKNRLFLVLLLFYALLYSLQIDRVDSEYSIDIVDSASDEENSSLVRVAESILTVNA